MILLLALLLVSHEAAGASESPFPPTLGSSGLFPDLGTMRPRPDLVPYSINLSFWSDGAEKQRWMLLPPRGKIGFAQKGEWKFPAGILFVKHFTLGERPIETRLLRFNGTNVDGASYRWRADGRDADLLATNALAEVADATQSWYFPSPEDCRLCHNANAGFILGVNARQLNRDVANRFGKIENQLRVWSESGFLDRHLSAEDISGCARLTDTVSQSTIENAARSYLDVNCAFCHRPGGAVSNFDARFDTLLEQQNLIGGRVYLDQGIDGARVIAPNDPWRSILLLRMKNIDSVKMPPLAHEKVDSFGVRLLSDWIKSIPGPEVLAPPAIRPAACDLRPPVTVVITHLDPAATIRFTTNGLPPGKSSPVYTGPFLIKESATIRARAYAEGKTRSISAQETFVISEAN